MEFWRRTGPIACIIATIEKIAFKHFPHQYRKVIVMVDKANQFLPLLQWETNVVIRLIESFFGKRTSRRRTINELPSLDETSQRKKSRKRVHTILWRI